RQATERRAALSRARAASRARRTQAQPAVGPVARLDVTESGVQQVTYEQLQTVGVDLAGVPAASLAVTDRNGAVAIEVLGAPTFGPGSSVRFLGEPLDTLYTGTNVYRLHIDPSLAKRVTVFDPNAPAPTTTTTTTVPRTPPSSPPTPPRRTEDVRPSRTSTTTTSPATTVPPTTVPVDVVPVTEYTATAVEETNSEYSLTAPGTDPWFESMLVTMVGSPATAGSSVTLTSPVAGQPGHAAVDLWGITRSDIDAEHHVQLRVNGELIADAHFDDNQALRLEGTVPAGVLVDGANAVEVVLLDDTGITIGIVAVDRWEITYQRSTVAENGRLDLTAAGYRLDVTGFPAGGIVAYRVGADGSVVRVVTTDNAGTVQVPGTGSAQRYVLSAPASVRTPAVASLALPTGLATGSADYLIITNSIFSETLAPLVAYHQSQGRVVKVVDVNAIYEAYSHGVVDAAAIDAYLAQAVPALGVRWVLLVGADSVDYRDYDQDGSLSLLPSLYGSTGFTVTYAPIDPAYADVNGDGVPDVALGRFPARTTDELTTMIGKTLAYANQVSTDSVLLVSDTADGIDYAATNDGLAAEFDGWNVFRSDPDRQGVDPARAELLARLDAGVSVTMYLGHSSSQEWTEVGLFDAATAAGLTNSSPTVVVQFGCWNTYYVAPDADTMAHALLLDPTGGAAAVMGSSTLSSSGNDIALAGYLSAALADGTLTMGEAVLAAKQALQVHAGGATADAQLGWTILGDPALPVGGNG
ncbi:MAG: C25 family cysteine peptidase, partial [Ilumatobacteraceae bacterium]